MLRTIGAWAAAFAVLLGHPGEAESVDCAAPGLRVDAPAPLRGDLCDLASETAAVLAMCNLPLRRPILVEAVEEIIHPMSTCLGSYDCADEHIRVVVRDDYSALVEPGDPYGLIPPDVLLGALLAHEMAHALVEQNAGGRAVPLVDHEYIAAAMELERLAPEWRDVLLEDAGLAAPSEGRIDIWIYRLAPRRFAANAWLHFSLPGNGCALVGRLVSGEASFERPER
jgi:hypothetical protein